VYLDVKPENVLIGEYLNLTCIDYGSVERLDPHDSSPVEVFYTDDYAHRAVKNRKNNKPSSNRVRSSFARHELTHQFDYFALGISMLEILNQVALIRPHVVPQLPLYRSLHLLSTRLLDGQNSDREGENVYRYASQVFPSLQESDYKNLAYESLKEVQRDIAKERRRWSLEAKVSELATYSKDIVRVVPGFNTVLTERLKNLIEHPLVARLKYVTQLGLVSLVYPTADHSRFDHTLGSYTYTTYYLKSLFNDLGNPLFRNLVGEEDLSAVLLAALLHDLGQYPLAHDLEEVNEQIFKHGPIGMEILKDPMKDQHGRTLEDIIQDPKNGWGIRMDSVRRTLGELSKNLPADEDSKASLKTKLLSVIIDGQIDADKADYIIRDSARCELPYGQQLDIERLLRVLTIAMIPEPERRITLGVYDKGLVSAHAFGLARYQLLSTVYWHHTTRIIKAMLQYSTVMALPDTVFSSKSEAEPKQLEIRQKLLAFVRQLVPPFKLPEEFYRPLEASVALDLSAEPPQRVIDAVVNDRESDKEALPDTEEWYPGVAWTDWLMLQWIANLPDATVQSRNLIGGIQRRRLYKRIATFARGGPHDSLIRRFDEKTWPEKLDICRRFNEEVRKRLKRNWTHLNTVTPMDENGLDLLARQHLLILIDLPRPDQKIGYDEPLGVVPELKERLYHQDARQAFGDIAWRNIMVNMTMSSAPLRILCHPDIRTLVSAAYAPSEDSSSGPLESNFARVLADAMGLQRS
jgi:HD superfamily phosphohydrolase